MPRDDVQLNRHKKKHGHHHHHHHTLHGAKPVDANTQAAEWTGGEGPSEPQVPTPPSTHAAPHRLRGVYSIVFRDVALKGLNKWQRPKLNLNLYRDEESALSDLKKVTTANDSLSVTSTAPPYVASDASDSGAGVEWSHVASSGSVSAAAMAPIQSRAKQEEAADNEASFAKLLSKTPTESNETLHRWCLTSHTDPSSRHMRASTLEDPTDMLPALTFRDWSQFTAATTLGVSVVEVPSNITSSLPKAGSGASNTSSSPTSPQSRAAEQKAQQHHRIFSVLLPNSSPSASPTKENFAGPGSPLSPSKDCTPATVDIQPRTICLGIANIGEELSLMQPGTTVQIPLTLRVPDRVKGGRVARLRRATYDMVMNVRSVLLVVQWPNLEHRFPSPPWLKHASVFTSLSLSLSLSSLPDAPSISPLPDSER